MPVPAFPVGAVKDKVMRWRDDFESVLMLAKGGAALRIGDIARDEMSKEELTDEHRVLMGTGRHLCRTVYRVPADL